MPDAITRPWLSFRGSEIQKTIHEHLTAEINTARTKLENAQISEVVGLQKEIEASRRLLSFIHQHDTEDIQRVYARGN
jgi:hypothetical protein